MSNPTESQKHPDLIYAENGEPFKSRKELQAEMARKGIRNYAVVDLDGRFAAKVEAYWWVKFQAKSSTNDTNDVELMVNGETMIVKRGEQVCLPQRFLEAADHATYPQFQQLPGKPRKVVGQIQVYPYEKISPASEAEYRAMLNEGTKKTKDAIDRYGSDYDPDRIGVQ